MNKHLTMNDKNHLNQPLFIKLAEKLWTIRVVQFIELNRISKLTVT